MCALRYASNACCACRRQKRKCTKELPKCSLCDRLSHVCNYGLNEYVAPTPQTKSIVAELEDLTSRWRGKLLDPQVTYVQNTHSKPVSVASRSTTSFPTLFFLDHDIYKEARISIPTPTINIPDTISNILYDSNNLRLIAGEFFDTIHSWLPILCRKRYEIMLSVSDFLPTPDQALLFCAMRLLTDTTACSKEIKTDMYWTVRGFAATLEASAVMTPQFLQANILITSYELGHGIYPAAYLSIGKCSSIAKCMGLDNRKDSPQMVRMLGAWGQIEEVRRLWWAIRLLDRYVHLGFRGHALGTAEPQRGEILPADDALFERAEMSANEPLYVASPTSLQAGPFARACQASNLAGKVIGVLNDFYQQTDGRFQTALQLHRTLTAFTKVVESEFQTSPERFATPLAIAYGAQMALYEPYCCTESNHGDHTIEELELQKICIIGIRTISDDVSRFVIRLQPSMEIRRGAMSPLLGYCLYMACVTAAWRNFEGEVDQGVSYRVLESALNTLGSRWAIGGEYLHAVYKNKELLYPDT